MKTKHLKRNHPRLLRRAICEAAHPNATNGASRTEARQHSISIRIPISFPRHYDASHTMKKTKIVIAGGGFAGLYAAKYLDKRLARRPDIEVTLDQSRKFYSLHADAA